MAWDPDTLVLTVTLPAVKGFKRVHVPVTYTDIQENTALPQPSRGTAWWPAALAHALMQKRRVTCTSGGDVNEGLELLLGRQVKLIEPKKNTEFSAEQLIKFFSMARESGNPATIGTYNKKELFSKEDPFLVAAHTYAVQDYDRETQKVTLLTPWHTTKERRDKKTYPVSALVGKIDQLAQVDVDRLKRSVMDDSAPVDDSTPIP